MRDEECGSHIWPQGPVMHQITFQISKEQKKVGLWLNYCKNSLGFDLALCLWSSHVVIMIMIIINIIPYYSTHNR